MTRLIVTLMLLASAYAHADEPWARGVSKKTQAEASQLFAEANQLFAQQAHAPALEKYRAAIALWNHPLIRFNMAVTEIRLDRILEAATDLEEALRYGDRPFTPELYRQVLDYQRLTAGRAGRVEASCDLEGAHVSIDGKRWFQCPGTHRMLVLAGEHALVAEAPGHMTVSRRIVATGGTTIVEMLAPVPFTSSVLATPSPRWIPWTIAATGLAIAVGGVGVYRAGLLQADRFGLEAAMRCADGCEPDLADQPDLARERDSVILKNKLGAAAIVTGGVLLIGGVVWGGILNRPRYVPAVELATGAGGGSVRAWWSF